MKVFKIIAIALIVVGVLGLVYGSFTYTKDTHNTDLGVFELSVKDKETVKIPIWIGAGAIVIGCLLLFFGPKKR
jgi:TRAP-type C4-dicarboxylate transport system permease small subunit